MTPVEGSGLAVISLLAVGAAFGLSLLLVPAVRRLSFRLGRVALPRPDRWHAQPTPTLGGIGIFAAAGLTLLGASLVGFRAVIPWNLLAATAVMFALGLVDDLKRLSPRAKLLGQAAAATLAISQGVRTDFFSIRLASPLGSLPDILLTLLWLVGITNAINLLDNMDGLAGGIAAIAALFLSYFFWTGGETGLLLVALAVAGAVLGFLVFNFPPASIFMGDSGSLFLGFTLALLAIARPPQASNVFAVMGVPTLLLLLPILDTTLVTVTRLLRGQSPAQGGRDHTSHRLVAFGLSERGAVLALYGMAVVAGVLAVALESLSYTLSLALLPVTVIGLALVTAYLGGLKVVAAPAIPPRPLTRLMLELTYRRRLLEVLLDLFLSGSALYLAFVTRYGLGGMTPARLVLFTRTLPVAVVCALAAFFVLGVYRGVWRYVGLDEAVRYVESAVGAVALTGVALLVIYPAERYSNSLLLLYGMYLFLGLAASRASFRLIEAAAPRRRAAAARVLIGGADAAGELALRYLHAHPELGLQAVGFIDDDPRLSGRSIHGVSVLGGWERLAEIAQGRQAVGVILTLDEPSAAAVWTAAPHLWVKRLRLELVDFE